MIKTNLPAVTPLTPTATQTSIKFCFNVTSFAEVSDISYVIYNEATPTEPVDTGTVLAVGSFWPYGMEVNVEKEELEYNSGTYVCELTATNANGSTTATQRATLEKYIDWAEPESVVSGNRFMADGVEEIGTLPEKTSADITVDGGTVTVPMGAYSEESTVEVEVATADYLCFTAFEANSSVALQNQYGYSTVVTLYKSTDKENWSLWDGSAVNLSNIGDSVWIYGENNSTMEGKQFVITGSVTCTGDLLTLLDQNGEVETLPSYCFSLLFSDCDGLISFESLPSITSERSYLSMFKDCNSLATAPVLPATTLASHCYDGLFKDCTALVTAPNLPATTLAVGCYDSMFYGCTALVNAPVLYATTLATTCYARMFQNCTSLVNAPVLSATTMASYCYGQMFQGCTSLVTAPNLPATTLAENCYIRMFQGCTALVNAPVLPATTLAQFCYSMMFNGCSSLSEVTVYAEDWNTTYTQNWLENCAANGFVYNLGGATIPTDSNSGIPTGWYEETHAYVPEYFWVQDPNTTNGIVIANNWMGGPKSVPFPNVEYSLDGGTTWNTVDENNPYIYPTEVNQKVYLRGSNPNGFNAGFNANESWTFDKTYNIRLDYNCNIGGDIATLLFKDRNYITIPNSAYYRLFMDSNVVNASQLKIYRVGELSCREMFENCHSLNSVPVLPATTLANGCYNLMFAGTNALTTVPNNMLPATTLAAGCYNSMFYSGGLVTPPELPATTLAVNCYNSMFSECDSLSSAPDLPATTLEQNCYYNMFNLCTPSLTVGPHIYATTMTNGCDNALSEMFNQCQYLKEITVEFEDWNTNVTGNWLANVASVGTLYNNGGATIPTGTNGIPTGWTEVKPADYLCFTGGPNGSAVSFTPSQDITDDQSQPVTVSLYKSSDKTNWTLWDNSTVNLSEGEKLYLYGENPYGISAGENSQSYFTVTGETAVSGDVMTLLSVTGNYPQDGANFWSLFTGTDITSAPKVTATTFMHGSGDTGACEHMFEGCTHLTTLPSGMFTATTLDDAYCFLRMFAGCTSLTNVPNDLLPATTLNNDHIYANMFEGCTSLTTAPNLPATTLGSDCYEHMFESCRSLSSVTLWYAGQDWDDGDTNHYANSWLYDVAVNGTVYNYGGTNLPTNDSGGVPSGWTEVRS